MMHRRIPSSDPAANPCESAPPPTRLGSVSLKSSLLRYAIALVFGYVWHLAFETHAGSGPRVVGAPAPSGDPPTHVARIADLGSPQAPRGSDGPTEAPDGSATGSNFRAEVERVQSSAHRHPEGSAAYWTELEQGFRRLRSRYPSEAEVYAELLFVADHRDGSDADALADEILRWPAPEAVKEKTRGVRRKKAALGQPFELLLTATDGTPIRVSEWRGRVVLIDFWATWCPPCREKLPELRSLYTKLHPRGLEIVGISFDDDLERLRRFVAAERIPWKQVADGMGWSDSPRARESGLTQLPSLWLVDRRGRLRDVDVHTDLATRLERLLAE